MPFYFFSLLIIYAAFLHITKMSITLIGNRFKTLSENIFILLSFMVLFVALGVSVFFKRNNALNIFFFFTAPEVLLHPVL